jgi:hypothetical protein
LWVGMTANTIPDPAILRLSLIMPMGGVIGE